MHVERGNFPDAMYIVLLLSQGEVEQIAMMKPKAPTEHEDGMLEFLEDIVGSSRYKLPIEQLAKRVEELNDMRSEKVLNDEESVDSKGVVKSPPRICD